MTKIKLCGLTRECDIEAANEQRPDYVGFVFAPKSKRYVSHDIALNLKKLLSPDIKAVGVFVDEKAETVAELLENGIIDRAQLHGTEDEEYIEKLRKLTDRPIIKAFRIEDSSDVAEAVKSTADYILLDSGAGTGSVFDWELIKNIERPYFLAGGLTPENVSEAIEMLHPYAADVSSGIETDGKKDRLKMAKFVAAVRKDDRI